jgi:2-dehydro-3-deoxyphosphogalactonate aldolase
MNALQERMAELPLIAILRGVEPHEVVAVGRALIGAGFRAIEVPLNSPQPLQRLNGLRQTSASAR